MEGWIRTYRSIINHWIWRDSGYLKAWMYLLFRANFKESNVLIDTTLVKVDRGQFVTSLNKLSQETNLTVQRLRTFLKLLESDQMVKVETTSKLTKITICNYESYQDLQHSANTVPTQCQHSANTVLTTEKKEKNLKNDKNEKDIYPFEAFWNLYNYKIGKYKSKAKWNLLSIEEKKKSMEVVADYVKSTPDVKFRKHPLTWLNGKCWDDDINFSLSQNTKPTTTTRKPNIVTKTGYDDFKFD